MEYSPTELDNGECNLELLCKEFSNMYSQLPQYKTNLEYKFIEIEKEKIDLLHYIEFNKMNASKGYKAFKMLQDCLLRRRDIQDEIVRVNSLIESDINDLVNGKTLARMEGLHNRKYAPRILTELFESEGNKNED